MGEEDVGDDGEGVDDGEEEEQVAEHPQRQVERGDEPGHRRVLRGGPKEVLRARPAPAGVSPAVLRPA